MAKNQNVRLKPVQLQADLDALTALNGFAVYTPSQHRLRQNGSRRQANSHESCVGRQKCRTDCAGNRARCRSRAEWDFHNTILGVKEQTIAQFGKSSDQVQMLGLKKKTEYKTPARRGKAKAA
jgi:hypothetical protein